jgi:oligopeptide/dipeptide ABC transporter ATP-binding protein
LDEEQQRLTRILGQPPSLIDVPDGCAFHPRCPFARLPDPCAGTVPELRATRVPEHRVACHFSDQLVDVAIHAVEPL